MSIGDAKHQPRSFLASRLLGELLSNLAPLGCLDIGSRGGPSADLDPLAWAVDFFCFEADPQECERLERKFASQSRYRSLRFLPEALSEHGGPRKLHLTRRRGCSTMLEPMLDIGQEFSREEFVRVDEIIEVNTVTLDQAVAKYGLDDAVFMKIDVEGMELEVFRSAPKLLSSTMLAIRCEVNFLPTRVGQPSYSDIDHHLRDYGFRPMRFRELHHWRRLTRRRESRTIRGPVPYSLGEIAHGDMLFFRHPESIEGSSDAVAGLLLRQAFLALTYGHADYAHYVFTLPQVADSLGSTSRQELLSALSTASRTLLARRRAAARARLWKKPTKGLARSFQRLLGRNR
jgi:FkbM family methyltransferase